MPVVLTALLPVFLLIALGFGLKRTLLPHEAQWHGLEQIVYYILFPALMIQTLARADLASVPVAGVGAALMLAVLTMTAICLLLRPFLARQLNIGGAAFTSIFQGATRWQTYVALAVAANLYGAIGLTLASVAMVAMTPLLNIICVWVLAHYATPQRLSWGAILRTIGKNPFIWACAFGIVLNLLHVPFTGVVYDFTDALSRSALAIGLLCVGAGLRLQGVVRAGAPAWIAVTLKLMVLPAIAVALGYAFGLSGSSLVVVACCASVPTSSSSYVLARQMGGDAPLVAEILTLQTVLAAITMPTVIALVA
jgi:predicted permease